MANSRNFLRRRPLVLLGGGRSLSTIGDAMSNRVTVHYGTEHDEIIGRNDDGAWDAIRLGERRQTAPVLTRKLLRSKAR
jgi:hypothetical protein